ncbi:MAG TPA: hypothetical protein PLO02_10790 [Tenuifilaceae bacterium]|jgi:hypothetical protein|nr:MAG: hypothetical protein BWX49_00747 [Bacteroidetes bacterium ADurb.Bin008]HPK86379.1 hypothetical protein [Bacilli bacterium]HQG20107.1 hypothetical protein [Tenuifilaceae bacterium]HQI60292.1 hypothetical protein [Tenuifilaceae bacterium]
MNKIILNIGLWSAIICLTSFIVWIISFTGIAIQSPLLYWTNVEDYIDYYKNNSQLFQYLAKSFMIIFSIAYMILTIVFYEFATTERKILAKIGIVFSIMFALVSSILYFLQISSVRFAIAANEYSGLEHLLQSNPKSALLSVNMLGWALFLGLSSLFMYFGLISKSVTKGLKLGLLINVISCFFGGVGYLFQIDLLTFIFMNLGIGLGFFMITISSIKFINTLKRENK